MSTMWLSVQHSRLGRKDGSVSRTRELVSTREVTGTGRRVGRLGMRDHRDDGSAIGGLLVGLVFAVLAWALIIALLVVLL